MNTNIKKIIAVGVLIALTGAQSWGKTNNNDELFNATLNGDTKKVQKLLDDGAKIDKRNSSKARNTPLMGAAMGGHDQVAQMLLDYDAKVNKTNMNGDTALMWAAITGHDKIVKLLLDYGAEINKKNKHRKTALMGAAWTGRKQVVQTLLEAGADPKIQSDAGQTALDLAKELENKQSDINSDIAKNAQATQNILENWNNNLKNN